MKSTGETISVLIADDKEQDRILLKEAIRTHAPSFKVIGELQDGAEVIDYLSGKGQFTDRGEHPLPDLLLLDLRMPRKDGFEVLEWLQSHPTPHLKVAVRADSSGIAYRSEALAMGADYFLRKLIDAGESAEAVRELEQEIRRSGPQETGH